MQVQVNQACGRCGKIEPVQMELTEAQGLADADKDSHEAEEALPALLNEALGASHPDVIVAVRGGGTDGRYIVKTLRGLCDFPEATRNKGCKIRVTGLIEEMFMTAPPRVTKPKKPKKTDPKEEPSNPPPEASTKAKSGKKK